MLRLRDRTIRAKLYTLVIISDLVLVAILTFSGYLLWQYRVDGPVYDRLMARKSVMAEFEPNTLYVVEPYLTLQELMNATDAAEVRRLEDRFRQQAKEVRDRQAHWDSNLFEGPTKQVLQRDVNPTANEFLRIAQDEFLPLVVGKGDANAAQQVFNSKVRPRFRDHRRAVEGAVTVAQQRTKEEEEEAARLTLFWFRAMVALSLVSVAVIGALGWLLSRDILRSTSLLSRRVHEMASGASDLTARVAIDSKDELAHLATGINAMIVKIHAVVQRVRESSLQLLSTASQIAATSRQQEATMQQLGSSTTEIAAAVREISATSKELSGTMGEVNERANQAAELATGGRTRLAAMETAMQQLVESTASISSKLAVIREKADNINLVVTTITKVADQTNLLSINAAIEAEKAGEYGRGFLVVAREIRRLADQTAVATLDIENIVRHMQDAVSAGVMQMDKFSEEVRTGVARIAEINGQIGQIIEEVRGLSDRFRLVNEGMRNQAIGAQQINEAMLQVTQGTQQTAASLEEFNKATAHLRGSVELLNQEIAQFKI